MKNYFLYDHGGSGNHGCEALVRTSIRLMGDSKPVLFSENPKEDIKYGIDEVARVCSAVRPVGKLHPAYLRAYADLKIRHDYHTMDALPFQKALSRAGRDAVGISIGGDNYCYDYYPRFIRVHQKLAGKCPTVLLGCSLEKHLFRDPDFIRDMKAYTLISARETCSYQSLLSAGLENVIYAPDTAFRLETEYSPLPAGFQEGNTIGINVSPLLVRREAASGMVMDNFRELIRYILKETDCSIALLPHVVQQGNDDRTVLSQLCSEFMDSKRMVMIADCDCRKLKGYIARCRFLIAARTHASIAAYSTHVPALVTGYSVKARGLANDLFGTEEGYVVSVRELTEKDRLKREWIRLFDKEAEVRNALQNRMPQYQKGLSLLEDRLSQILTGEDI